MPAHLFEQDTLSPVSRGRGGSVPNRKLHAFLDCSVVGIHDETQLLKGSIIDSRLDHERLEIGNHEWPGAMLHVVVTIIEQRPTIDRGNFLLGITLLQCKIKKMGKVGSGHDCQLDGGRSGQMKSGS
jgi:hypothetical protein